MAFVLIALNDIQLMIKADLTKPVFSRISIFLSSLCIVHCLATPFILLLLPTLSTFFSETLERILILLVIPLSLVGFMPRWLAHKNYANLLIYVFSVLLILFSQFILHSSHSHEAYASLAHLPWAGTAVTFTGAFMLAWVVYKNNRHTHSCSHPHHTGCHGHPAEKKYSHSDFGQDQNHCSATGNVSVHESENVHEVTCRS